MIKPIIWTVLAVLTIILALMATGGGIWKFVLIAAALCCAILQWKVFIKNK